MLTIFWQNEQLHCSWLKTDTISSSLRLKYNGVFMPENCCQNKSLFKIPLKLETCIVSVLIIGKHHYREKSKESYTSGLCCIWSLLEWVKSDIPREILSIANSKIGANKRVSLRYIGLWYKGWVQILSNKLRPSSMFFSLLRLKPKK